MKTDVQYKPPNTSRRMDWFEEGTKHFTDGNYDAAIEFFSRSIEINPRHPQSYLLRGSSYRKKQKFHEAISDYTTGIKLDSRFAQPYIIRGDLFAKIGNFSQAIVDYNRALFITPLDDEIYIRRGKAWAALKEYSQAAVDFNKATIINENNIKVIKKKIDGEYKIIKIEGSNIKALLNKETNTSMQDKDALLEAHLNRGIIRARKRQHKYAEEDYEKVLEVRPNYSRAFLIKGEISYRKGHYDDAISLYTDGLNYHPESTDIYLSRGLIWMESGKYDAAIGDFNKALEIEKYLSTAFYCRGIAYKRKGNLTQAIRDFTSSLEINPFNSEAFIERGLALTQAENLHMAIDDFTSALKLKPQNSDLYHYRGKARFSNRDFTQSVVDYEMAIGLSKIPLKTKIIKEFANLLATSNDKKIINCPLIPTLIYSARKFYAKKSELMNIFQESFKRSNRMDDFRLLKRRFYTWVKRDGFFKIKKELYEEGYFKSCSEQLVELGANLQFEESNRNDPNIIKEIRDEIVELNFLQRRLSILSGKSSDIIFIDPEIEKLFYVLGLKKIKNVVGFKGPYYPPFHDRRDDIDSRTICPLTSRKKRWFPAYKGPAANHSYFVWILRYPGDYYDDDYDDVVEKHREILNYWRQKRKREVELDKRYNRLSSAKKAANHARHLLSDELGISKDSL